MSRLMERRSTESVLMTALKVTLVLFAAQLAPRPNKWLTDLFKNTYVKIVAVAGIAYIANEDLQLAIILAIIYVFAINLSAGRGVLESFEGELVSYEKDMSKLKDLLGKPVPPPFGTIIESESDIYPGCKSIKLADLLKIFEGDAVKLQQTVVYTYSQMMQKLKSSTAKDRLIEMARIIGIPYNMEINEANANFVATFLVNAGFKISESCAAPSDSILKM